MTTYKITYSGQDNVLVRAKTKQEAEEKFWEEGLNDLNYSEIDEINECGSEEK